MPYEVPGRADQLKPNVIQKWNETIEAAYDSSEPQFGSRFFTLDPQTLQNPVPASIKWFAEPAEPNFCLGPDVARQLSDWGVKGRHEVQNEYCEYCVIQRPDQTGRSRPKRVHVTTELREYWVCVAKHDPGAVRDMAQGILEVQPTWQDLYGVADPQQLTGAQREIAFSKLVAGHGNDRKLQSAGVPAQPTGKLNTENALFMTHPINGLDDLLYIVMFGAKPYARRISGGLEPATREQIFREFGVEHLACRHADPTAAIGAHGAAYNGMTVAFANPLGMYIRSFAKDVFLINNNPVPDSWIRWSRGQAGMYQHLEFGPADGDAEFLDDIRVAVGASEEPLTGGFQVVQNIEVGPLVVAGGATPVAENEYVVLNTSSAPIRCHEADICTSIKRLKADYDARPTVRVAPRTMRPGD